MGETPVELLTGEFLREKISGNSFKFVSRREISSTLLAQPGGKEDKPEDLSETKKRQK